MTWLRVLFARCAAARVSSARRWRASLIALCCVGSLQCGDDERTSVTTPPGSREPERSDAQIDAEPAEVGGRVEFRVPPRGGTAKVQSLGGLTVAFNFPASAGGEMIALTPQSASAIGWPEQQFGEVIRMEPDGLRFQHPVVIRPESGDVILLAFASGAARSKPEALPLNTAGDGFLLSHFSTLAVVPPWSSCDVRSGWVVADSVASARRCSDRKAPRYIHFDCSSPVYCLAIDAQCCADEEATACQLGDLQLSVSFDTAPYDDRYPYCRAAVASDAGPSDSGSVSLNECTPGAASPCTCHDYATGTKLCAPSGSEFFACQCPNDGAVGAGGEGAGAADGSTLASTAGSGGEGEAGSGAAGGPAAGSGGESGAAGSAAAGTGGDGAAGESGMSAAGSGGEGGAGEPGPEAGSGGTGEPEPAAGSAGEGGTGEPEPAPAAGSGGEGGTGEAGSADAASGAGGEGALEAGSGGEGGSESTAGEGGGGEGGSEAPPP